MAGEPPGKYMAEQDYSVNENADAATDAALQGISVSEPENSLPRVTLEELPQAVNNIIMHTDSTIHKTFFISSSPCYFLHALIS